MMTLHYYELEFVARGSHRYGVASDLLVSWNTELMTCYEGPIVLSHEAYKEVVTDEDKDGIIQTENIRI